MEAFAINVPDAVGFLLLKRPWETFGNNQLWQGDADLLRESLEVVQQTAAVILGGIPPRLRWWPPPDEYLA